MAVLACRKLVEKHLDMYAGSSSWVFQGFNWDFWKLRLGMVHPD